MHEPWVRFEDEHVLVVVKPSGVNTHRADEHAQDGMYEWVQRQRPTEPLSILHRLDKGTSGLLLFGKSRLANQQIAAQFEGRTVTKRYELLVPSPRPGGRSGPDELRSDEPVRSGSSSHAGRSGDVAASTDLTRTRVGVAFEQFSAYPHTGRTHQVRIHSAGLGMPILGDERYGGAPSVRLFLHAGGLCFRHPDGDTIDLTDDPPPSFDRVLVAPHAHDVLAPELAAQAALEARVALFDPSETNAYLWIDRHHDGFPDVRVERFGDVVLALNYQADGAPLPPEWIKAWNEVASPIAVIEQRRPRGGGGGAAHAIRGSVPPRFEVTEMGRRYLVDFAASETSSGLFLDQRETRRRLAHTDLRGRSVLNAFGHTGSLSVAAASAGAETLTLDLSKRYLDWARDNLLANDLDPSDHDFIYGDALEWMDRLHKKGRVFDIVIVDPPSSSTSGGKGSKRWVVERDLHELVARGARMCAPGGTLFVSTNLRRMEWPRFLGHLSRGLDAAGRTGSVETQTVPLDHRCGPGDPAYLKAAWVQLDTA